MKTSMSVLRLSAPVLALGLALSASAQVTSPNGSYGILGNRWIDSSNAASGFLGVLNFDGAGNVSGSYTLVAKNYAVSTGTMTGTYSGNPDGSNTVNLTFDVGVTLTAAVAITDGGTGLQLLATGGTLLKPGQVFTGTGRNQSAQGTNPAGSYGFLLNRWPDANHYSQSIFGVLNLDGAGNVRGSYAITRTTDPTFFSGTLTGAYSINPSGAGSLTVSLDVGVTATFAIVVTDGGSGVLMLQTDESDGFSQVVSGTARMQ
jgi:hypothetical protein